MADLPTISVILPTRSRPAFLAEALRSAMAQTLPPHQVIVVDDGGEDEAARVVGATRPPPSTVVRVIAGPGRGPGAARNAGLSASGGELVAFLDDDDVWRPRKLEAQAKWFAERPRLGVLGTGYSSGWTVAGASPPARQGATGRIRTVAMASLVRANRLVTSSVVARRRCLVECGWFDESLALAQDWDLWLRAAARWEVAVVPEPLVFYRRHDGQRSADPAEMRFWEGEVLRRALGRGLPGRWLTAVARRRLAWSHARLGRLLARGGEPEGALEELRRAMELSVYNPVAWVDLARCVATIWAGARRGAPLHDRAHRGSGARQLPWVKP